jgi:cysteine desulfurase
MFGLKRAYLDYASAAPVLRIARRAFSRACTAYGNPSSPHAEGRRAKKILDEAREKIARLVEAKADDVVFTSGATEANNLAIRGLVKPGSHLLYMPGSHASIAESVKALDGVVIEPIPLLDGHVDIAALKKLIRPKTALVTLEAVCSETGTIWDTHKIKSILPKGVLLHVDASQAPLTQKITRSHFGADLLTLDAQKIGAMRGAGVLIAPRMLDLSPIIVGGGQERGLRSGTPAPALAAAFAAALAHAVKKAESFEKRAQKDRDHFIALIRKSIPELYINEGARTVPHIVNFSLPGRDTDYLVTLLDTAGFAISTRSACETDSTEGSRAVYALTHDKTRAFSTVRVSWGLEARRHELSRLAKALSRAVAFIDKEGPKYHHVSNESR